MVTAIYRLLTGHVSYVYSGGRGRGIGRELQAGGCYEFNPPLPPTHTRTSLSQITLTGGILALSSAQHVTHLNGSLHTATDALGRWAASMAPASPCSHIWLCCNGTHWASMTVLAIQGSQRWTAMTMFGHTRLTEGGPPSPYLGIQGSQGGVYQGHRYYAKVT